MPLGAAAPGDPDPAAREGLLLTQQAARGGRGGKGQLDQSRGARVACPEMIPA